MIREKLENLLENRIEELNNCIKRYRESIRYAENNKNDTLIEDNHISKMEGYIAEEENRIKILEELHDALYGN